MPDALPENKEERRKKVPHTLQERTLEIEERIYPWKFARRLRIICAQLGNADLRAALLRR